MLLRLANVFSALSGFSLTLEGGDMQLFRIDGGNDVVTSDPVQSIGIISLGERVDIITPRGGKSLTISLDLEYAQFLYAVSLTDEGPETKKT